MIALEAWALKKPVVATAHGAVVMGMCARSNAGLFYRDAEEFAEVLHLLVTDEGLAQDLGANGSLFVEQYYTWDKVKEKYLRMIDMVMTQRWA
jgi:glycosyltransferase involved in cell wall biosynthesis